MATHHSPPPPILLLLLLSFAVHAAAQPSPPSPDDYNLTANNFSSSTAIIIVILISVFFFLAFFSIYSRQCSLGRSSSATSRRIFSESAAARRSHRRGLDLAVLETFPTMVYSQVKMHRTDKGPLECAVCLSEFADDETLRMLPRCSHAFHPDCIDAWLASHVTCPVCRSNLADPADAAKDAEPTPAAPEDHVTIDVDPSSEEGGEQEQEEAFLAPAAARFPRSHTTGHDSAVDRYTLRLPEHVVKEIVAAGKFRRAASCVAFPAGGEASGRRGYRGAGEGSIRGGRSARSDRWAAPVFLARALSMRVTAWASGRRGEGEGSVRKKEATEGSARGVFPAAVRAPFDCLGGGGAGGGGGGGSEHGGGENESSTAPLARV